MNNKKISLSMGITCILMVAIVMLQFTGSIVLGNIVGIQFLNISTVIKIISYVLIMAFFYALYTKEDVEKLAIAVISIWGIINLVPMINNIISAVKSLIYSMQMSTVAVLIYMLILLMVFAFIVIVSIYFIIDKDKKFNYVLTYGICILIMVLTIFGYDAWLKLSGYASELTAVNLLVNVFVSGFYLFLNILKYVILVLVVKEKKGGIYLMLCYVLVWFILFIGKSLSIFMSLNVGTIAITFLIYLVPFIFYTYVLVMGLTVSTREIIGSKERR